MTKANRIRTFLIPCLEVNIGIVGSLIRNPDASDNSNLEFVSIFTTQVYEETTLIRSAQLRRVLAGLKSKRKELKIFLAIHDEDFALCTKLGVVQLRVCETNLDLRAAIQLKRDDLSDSMQVCIDILSTLEEQCKIAHGLFRPILDRTLDVMGDLDEDTTMEEQLPAYAPRS